MTRITTTPETRKPCLVGFPVALALVQMALDDAPQGQAEQEGAH